MNKIKEKLAYRRIDGEMFVVDAQESKLHELNGPAAVIWEGLAKGKTENEIALLISSEYEVSAETALTDTREFISALSTLGLLVNA